MRKPMYWFWALIFLSACSSLPPQPVTERYQGVTPAKPEAPVTQPAAKPSKPPSPLLVLDHKYFIVHYDPRFRLARYVTYTLTAEQLKKPAKKRRDKFFADPILTSLGQKAVTHKDYARSGYDRGHLAPAADFSFSQEASDATFVMSNMAPQTPNLNRDAWQRLEAKVRRWACGEEKISVITGPVLEEGLPRLPSGVPVPKQFFKIVVDETPPRKVLAFLYNQTDKGDVLNERVVPVREVEEKTQEDFQPLIEGGEMRAPSQVADWKEKDC